MGCYLRILKKVPINVLVRVLQSIVEKEKISTDSVIIIDMLLDVCLEEGRPEGSMQKFFGVCLFVRTDDI